MIAFCEARACDESEIIIARIFCCTIEPVPQVKALHYLMRCALVSGCVDVPRVSDTCFIYLYSVIGAAFIPMQNRRDLLFYITKLSFSIHK